ncbi:MAG: hypothetical protein WCK11_03095 [Candidatus Falkowbacteria bacterium]
MRVKNRDRSDELSKKLRKSLTNPTATHTLNQSGQQLVVSLHLFDPSLALMLETWAVKLVPLSYPQESISITLNALHPISSAPINTLLINGLPLETFEASVRGVILSGHSIYWSQPQTVCMSSILAKKGVKLVEVPIIPCRHIRDFNTSLKLSAKEISNRNGRFLTGEHSPLDEIRKLICQARKKPRI